MVDAVLLLLLVGAAVLGWRRGLAVSLVAGAVFVLAGLPVAALAVATGMAPPAMGYLLGGLLALVPVALRLDAIQQSVESAIDAEWWRVADRAGGAALNVLVASCLAWFVGALAAIVPADSAALSSMRSSAVLGSLVQAVPPQGTLGALVLRSGLVPAVDGPLVLAEPPDPSSATTPGVLAAASRVLQVRSTACGQILTGTGWVAGAGIVVTNGHVVAGSRRSFLAGGPRFDGAPAVVTAFDPVNDIAVLVLERGPATLPAPLAIVARVQHGERAAVIGFPRGGELLVEPARIDRVAEYPVSPLGGGPDQPANVLALRADVQPGNSGGPVLAEDGTALGMVVAKGLGQRVEAAYGVPGATLLAAIAEGARRVPVPTGPCLDAKGQPSLDDRPGELPEPGQPSTGAASAPDDPSRGNGSSG